MKCLKDVKEQETKIKRNKCDWMILYENFIKIIKKLLYHSHLILNLGPL